MNVDYETHIEFRICLMRNLGWTPNSAVKVLKNRIMLIMRVNPDLRTVSMVSVNYWLRVVNRFRICLMRNLGWI